VSGRIPPPPSGFAQASRRASRRARRRLADRFPAGAGSLPRGRGTPYPCGMPRWIFVLFAAALFLSVFGIVLTFIKTGPTQNQPSRPPEQPAATAPRNP
jgi:hypothetical protein